MKKGKFLVLYGANNLGKSKQVDMLEKALQKKGIKTVRIKYPIYDLKPTGPKINAVLREGLKMPDLDLQKLYAQNRADFEPKLESYLNAGKWVLAEDYTGTGIAWGMTWGVPLETLEKINKKLLKEDLAILLHGERFVSGIEKNHRNETNNEIWEKSQKIHLELAHRYKWIKVYATRTPEEVHEDIINIIKNTFSIV
jgi:thymidylate kinase